MDPPAATPGPGKGWSLAARDAPVPAVSWPSRSLNTRVAKVASSARRPLGNRGRSYRGSPLRVLTTWPRDPSCGAFLLQPRGARSWPESGRGLPHHPASAEGPPGPDAASGKGWLLDRGLCYPMRAAISLCHRASIASRRAFSRSGSPRVASSTTLADYDGRCTFGIPAARVGVIHSQSATGRADDGDGVEI